MSVSNVNGPQIHDVQNPNPVALSEQKFVQNVAQQRLENYRPTEESVPPKLGQVIVIVGTSTAGKSSIISELRRYEPRFVESGIDQSGVRILLEFFDRCHPEEMAIIRKMFPSETPGLILDYVIHGDTPVFKSDAKAEDKASFPALAAKLKASYDSFFPPEGPWRKIESIMMDEVLATAKSGNPVIFDVLQIKKIVDHALFNDQSVKPKIALVFCPFQELAQRVVGRNNEAIERGNLGDVRLGVFPLEQFIKLFRPKRSENEKVVQTLSRRQVEEAFDLVFDSGIKFMQEHSKDRLKDRNLEQEKTEKKAQILKKLGFTEEDGPDKVIELTPRFKGYDILIDTSSTNKSKAESVRESTQNILFNVSSK